MGNSVRNSNTSIPAAAWYERGYEAPSKAGLDPREYQKLTAREIYNMLVKHVIEQDEACKAVAIMMFQHLQGHRSVNLLAGPTGAGKSFLTETLKDIFPDVVVLRNIADLTCDGWSGGKKVSSLFSNIKSTFVGDSNFGKFIVLDEADKCFTFKTSSGGGAPSEDVQAELLSVVHGAEINVSAGKDTIATIDTRYISFLFAGAFDKQARAIANEKSGGIGFGVCHDKVESYSEPITMADVHNAGCISELCGRIGKVIPVSKISADSYRRMLNNHKSGPLYELEKEFGIRFRISETAKDDICHNAWASELGVRSIKNQLRAYIDEAVWERKNPKCIEIG